MIYPSKIFKGGTSTSKNVGGVTVLNLCTSSDHILHLNQVLQKYLNGFPSLSGHDFPTTIYEVA